jgi:hypothetical protein
MKFLMRSGVISALSGSSFFFIFQLTKNFIHWPDFIAENIYYISGALLLIGIIIKFIYLGVTKDYKNLKQFALLWIVLIAMFFLFYFMK